VRCSALADVAAVSTVSVVSAAAVAGVYLLWRDGAADDSCPV